MPKSTTITRLKNGVYEVLNIEHVNRTPKHFLIERQDHAWAVVDVSGVHGEIIPVHIHTARTLARAKAFIATL